MAIELDQIEARVLGSLVEKQLTTPEYYPLTLNALTAACNQKSNREPVMALGETEILAAIDSLRDKNLVYLYYGSTSRTVKYKHMLPQVFELEPPAVAVLTLLLLRGPQTVGELRGRSDRLYEFSGLGEVEATLDELGRRDEPLVAKLDRQPGQKESRYAQVLTGAPVFLPSSESADLRAPTKDEDGRIGTLETELVRVSAELSELKAAFERFRDQFD